MEVGSWEWRYKSVPDLILLEIRRISTTTPHSQLLTPHSNKSLFLNNPNDHILSNLAPHCKG